MKKLIFIFLLFAGLNIPAQTAAAAKEVFEKIKKESKIDGSDKAVYHLLEEFYAENLQAENDEMSEETIEKTQKLASDPDTKNLHILMLFLMYQQHISQTAAVGKKPNPEFQMATMRMLEDEIKSVYGKIPAIIYVYQYEALSAGNKKEEAKATAFQGLKEYPDSVPLKVYTYLSTNDEAIKNDLLKNHSNHWMVKQFGIK
ncbi:hypothetical protein QE422_000191 [Chryseobacterium sp. SORGH_AS 447]|uniref:hypothetical protein n=1 Tax=Chryseobacterium sp. SORGH_AS_0447 TaxID=3041769 RepID=UPI0027808C9A|nr:hypothetical protein [Chryseobacterium sp. SORGH_AS_0447]MDQ1159823.1 hypothetical protein [Chryseobacterium sp. SORGH_AS_0447]